jgi:hypothetical protein
MEKKLTTAALVYAALGLAGGVFYREFTKALGTTAPTTLSVVHAHYLLLGTVFFVLLAVVEKVFALSAARGYKGWLTVYHIGLNVTVAGLLTRGVLQSTGTVLSRGLDASLSGVSGLGHLLLGAALIALLVLLRKRTA